jgi:hypothetical protein
MTTIAHVSFASPRLQDNRSFLVDLRPYQVDKRILKLTGEIFRYLVPQKTQSHKEGWRLPTLMAPGLSPQLLEHILSFFQSGQLQEDGLNQKTMKDLHTLSYTYDISLLHRYLQAAFKVNSLSQVEEQLSLMDQLELAALQQKPGKFCNLLNQLEAQTHSPKNVLSLVAHFQPEAFEVLMVEFIRSRLPSLYSAFLQTYIKKRQADLEDALYLFKDEQLKFACMAGIVPLKKRLSWFQLFWSKIPIEMIRQAIIQPLLKEQEFSEAKTWVLKIHDQTSTFMLFTELMQNQREKEALEIGTLISKARLTSGISALQNREELDLAPHFLSLSLNDSSAAPSSLLTVIHQIIEEHLSAVREFGIPNKTSGTLLNVLNEKMKPFDVKWNADLLVDVIRYHIQFTVEQYTKDIFADIQKDNIPVRAHEKHLHPAFQENYEVLSRLSTFLEDVLEAEFKSSDIHDLLGKKVQLLKGNRLFSEIISMARHLYCTAFSLQEDFIIQFVSAELHPYMIRQRDGSFPQPQESLIERLEARFKEIGLGEQLASSHIELALSVYIQKGVEAANFRHFFPSTDKLNIYHPTRSDAHSLLEMVLALQTAMKKDFPLDKVQSIAPQAAKLISNRAELIREVFIKAQQAYYHIFNYSRPKFKSHKVEQPHTTE